MPTNLTDVSTFTSPVAVPADGDARNAASVETPFQSLANRTKYLKDTIEAGSTKIRLVSSTAALKALTGMTTGDVAMVSTSAAEMGLYVFRTGSVVADQEYWFYQANDATGMWRRDIYPLAGYSNTDGLAKLNDSVVVVPNRIRDILRYSSSEVTLSESASWQTVLTSGSMTLYNGDEVILSFASSAKNTDITISPVSIRIAVTNPTPTTADAGTSTITYDFYTNNKRIHVGTQAVYTAAATGSHTLLVQALLPTGAGPYDVIFGNPSFQVILTRP